MVLRFRMLRRRVLPALLGVALAGTACSQAVNAGLGLLGIHRTAAAGAEKPAPPSSPSGAGASAAPTAPGTASIYEAMPATDWWRYAVGDPASPAFAFSRNRNRSSCLGAPWGVLRSLPLTLSTTPVYGLSTYGATADPATRGRDVFTGGVGMARWSMAQTARTGTYAEGCSQSVFAYVILGGKGAWEPVVVR